MRLNQSLFASEAVVTAEKKSMPSKLRKLDMKLMDDGLHVVGSWHAFIFNVPFDTVVNFVWTRPDSFEVRVGELDVAGIDFEFLSKFVLESIQNRIDSTLKGICTYHYIRERPDRSRALEVTMDSQKLIPAFPDLHLVGVDVREGEFLLKMGHTR